jgi:hypothetical protein
MQQRLSDSRRYFVVLTPKGEPKMKIFFTHPEEKTLNPKELPNQQTPNANIFSKTEE